VRRHAAAKYCSNAADVLGQCLIRSEGLEIGILFLGGVLGRAHDSSTESQAYVGPTAAFTFISRS
jgi:hypothetical protein